MSKPIDLTGRVFGKLTVSHRSKNTVYGTRSRVTWTCHCECGSVIEVVAASLSAGTTKSCGCSSGNIKHGLIRVAEADRGHYLYGVWANMILRCCDQQNIAYERYGGRGIGVCERWKGPEGFTRFVTDMGDRPEKTTLERVDNDGGYSPENCKWATRTEQNRNKRSNNYITINGVTKLLIDWASEYGISASALYGRVYIYKWPIDDSILVPAYANHNKPRKRTKK